MKQLLLLLGVALLAAAPVRAQTAADSAAVRQAALDYIEGWYEGNPERMARVKVDADSWIDYMHLARSDGRWKIVDVLWAIRPEPK